MASNTRATLISALVGAGFGTVCIVWGYPSLGVVTGLCWAGGLKLTLYIGSSHPEFATGETWTDTRWTGLGVGFVSLAALVGVSPLLPVSNELRLGLGFLVTGVGLVAYAAGTLAVLERVDDRDRVTVSPPDSRSPTDAEA